MRVATWNVNSVAARLPRLLPWLDERAPDVVCLQETKLSDEAFAEALAQPLAERGYAYAHYGQGQWNGVGLLSRVGLDDVQRGLPDEPRFPTPEAPADARALSATCGGLRVTSVYVPNGRDPSDPHYAYKLEWLAALRDRVEAAGPEASVVAGDFNIAPADPDVYSVEAFAESTHVTPPEREALAALVKTGLHDVVRERWPDERIFTYWDYRGGAFHQDRGMRIDLVLAGAPVARRRAAVWIDRKARKGTGPSDHAPVILDLDEAPDGDWGPVIPPPSLGRTRKR
jgi:exodeoxyribonuclease III